MPPLFLSRYTLVTALGRGLAANRAALEERRSGLRACDIDGADLNTYIGRIEGLEDRPVKGKALDRALAKLCDCRNNRLAQLGLEQDGFAEAVTEASRRYGAARVAVILGTSTSGIAETENAYQRRKGGTGPLPADFLPRYPYTHNTYSLAHFVRAYLGLAGPAVVISTACSSSAKVFASAARFIAAGLCDAAVVGGVDSLCLTTLYGFTALQLTSTRPCRPYDAAREGLSLGEAAGFALLETEANADASSSNIGLLGYGESSDGYHMSHPHPEGLGAISAMRDALARAQLAPEQIDYINLHGTATPANDRVEDRAVSSVFGKDVACSSTKGWTGHTLGAAGITESIIAALCLEHGFIPGTLNTETVDPTITSHIVLENRAQPIKRALNTIFGFGGNNCCLVLGRL